jgi:hypothetical protein
VCSLAAPAVDIASQRLAAGAKSHRSRSHDEGFKAEFETPGWLV